MHERLMRAIDEEDILIYDKWEEGDGRNDCRFYKRPESSPSQEGSAGTVFRSAVGRASALAIQDSI